MSTTLLRALGVPLVTAALGSACSSASSSASSAPDLPRGAWILCDSATAAKPSAFYAIAPFAGEYIELSSSDGILSASTATADGGTETVLQGRFDPQSRTWTADVFWPHNDGQGHYVLMYPAAATLTFSPDGNRFEGPVVIPELTTTAFGGRQDGAFACDSP